MQMPVSINTNKKFLVLDLDETLIHCKTTDFDGVTNISRIKVDDKERLIFVSKRPGLEEFMARMAKCYNLVLFTLGLKEYAHTILKMMKIDHYFSKVLHRGHCTNTSERRFEKKLAILGVPLRDIILLDDSLSHVHNQPYNILLIKPYTGNRKDRELSRVANYLEELAERPDVRPVMENFLNFELDQDSEGVSSKIEQTSPRNLNAKFIQGMDTPRGISTPRDTQMDTPRMLEREVQEKITSEFDLQDLCENYAVSELSSKVATLKPQRKLLLSSKLEFNTLATPRGCNDELKSALPDRFATCRGVKRTEELKISTSSSSECVTSATLKFAKSPSSLIGKLPIMTPKSLRSTQQTFTFPI